jgi:hypothetical protein
MTLDEQVARAQVHAFASNVSVGESAWHWLPWMNRFLEDQCAPGDHDYRRVSFMTETVYRCASCGMMATGGRREVLIFVTRRKRKE